MGPLTQGISNLNEIQIVQTRRTLNFSVDYEAEESVNRRSDDYVQDAKWNDFLNNLDKVETQAQKTKFYLQYLSGASDKKP